METNNTISYILFRIGVFTIITLITFITFSNCRTVKQRTSKQESMIQKHYTETQSRQAAMSQWWDSTGRYWSFTTDSAFYYHPDSGLYAARGLLSMSENSLQVQTQSTIVEDKQMKASAKEVFSIWKTYYRRVKDSKWTILVAVVLLAGVYWWYRYRRMR